MTLPAGVRLLVGNQDLTEQPDLKLSITDTTPGGFDTASFEVPVNRLPKIDALVSVLDETYNVAAWLGVVDVVNIRGGCGIITCTRPTRDKKLLGTVEGYPHTVFTAGERVQSIITEVMARTCPDVYDSGFIIDYNLQLADDSQDFAGSTFEDIANAMTALTTQFSGPMLWWVWDNFSYQMALYVNTLDQAPRYRTKIPQDQVEQTYDRASIINNASIRWGNGLYYTFPPAGQALDHTVLRQQRDKFVNADSNIQVLQDALALANNYYNRFSPLRSTSGSAVLKNGKDTVRSLLTTPPNDAWPLWLVRSGYAIDVNMDGVPAPYNLPLKQIVRKTYDFEAGEDNQGQLTLQFGELVNLDSQILLTPSFFRSRLYLGAFQAAFSAPLSDRDVPPQYGPSADGIAPSITGPGTATFIGPTRDASSDEQLKYDKLIHPDLVPDQGLEVNFSFDVTTSGFKGGTWSIPGEFDTIKVTLFKSTGLATDTVSFKIYTRVYGQPTLVPATPVPITLSGVYELRQTLGTPVLVKEKNAMIVIEVLTAGATAEVASISLHASKYHPKIGVIQNNMKPQN